MGTFFFIASMVGWALVVSLWDDLASARRDALKYREQSDANHAGWTKAWDEVARLRKRLQEAKRVLGEEDEDEEEGRNLAAG